MIHKVLCTLTLVSTITLGAFAQSNRPQAANNPNLQAKRSQKAQMQSVAKSNSQVAVDPMAMAKKYERAAVEQWMKEHPTVIFFTKEEYDKLDAAKKAEVGDNFITYSQHIKWADVQNFESKNKAILSK